MGIGAGWVVLICEPHCIGSDAEELRVRSKFPSSLVIPLGQAIPVAQDEGMSVGGLCTGRGILS